MYVMNLFINFCLDTDCSGDFSFTTVVMETVKLPKRTCQWTDSYRIKGRYMVAETRCNANYIMVCSCLKYILGLICFTRMDFSEQCHIEGEI